MSPYHDANKICRHFDSSTTDIHTPDASASVTMPMSMKAMKAMKTKMGRKTVKKKPSSAAPAAHAAEWKAFVFDNTLADGPKDEAHALHDKMMSAL